MSFIYNLVLGANAVACFRRKSTEPIETGDKIVERNSNATFETLLLRHITRTAV